jgi:hypothetical protein
MTDATNCRRRAAETADEFAARRVIWPTMTPAERKLDTAAYVARHPRVVTEEEKAANAARIAATPAPPPPLSKRTQARRTAKAAHQRLAELAAERALAARHDAQRRKHIVKLFLGFTP